MPATFPTPRRARRREFVRSTSVVLFVAFVGCRRVPEPSGAANSSNVDAAPSTASSGTDSGDAAPPEDKWAKKLIPPEALQAPAPPAADAGSALETPLYSFLLENVVRCVPSDAGAPAPAQADAAPSSQMATFGFEVRIHARSERLFVSPRDVKVRDGGIIFTSLLHGAGPRCEPRLKPTMILRGAETAGFVVFEIPLDETRHLELAYEPTRWGGAPPVTMRLPECLDCANEGPKAKPPRKR